MQSLTRPIVPHRSGNCLREVKHAVEKSKMLALVHDPVRGGATLESIKNDECEEGLQHIFKDPSSPTKDRKVIIWHRIMAFQEVSLKLLAQQIIRGCEYGNSRKLMLEEPRPQRFNIIRRLSPIRSFFFRSKRGMDGNQPKCNPQTQDNENDLYIPGEITESAL